MHGGSCSPTPRTWCVRWHSAWLQPSPRHGVRWCCCFTVAATGSCLSAGSATTLRIWEENPSLYSSSRLSSCMPEQYVPEQYAREFTHSPCHCRLVTAARAAQAAAAMMAAAAGPFPTARRHRLPCSSWSSSPLQQAALPRATPCSSCGGCHVTVPHQHSDRSCQSRCRRRRRRSSRR